MGSRFATLGKKWAAFKQSQLPPLLSIKKDLKQKSNCVKEASVSITELPVADQQLIDQINKRTRQHNMNNVTRTRAYYDFYCRHPEIHWAFLGHMVSRNGGWNMTDLKGELLSRLLSEKEQQEYFQFLERGNWLIFQDVYPQFLLYEESLKRQTNLFHLLPYFHVSVFMQTLWNHFYEYKDCYILTIGLVINEQSYLEKRVIQNPFYQKTVIKTFEFTLQDILSLNQILFPCDQEQLIGQTLHQFASLHERILLGKRLYTLLFSADVLHCVSRWAAKHVHTGSRKDYWPHLFNDVKESLPNTSYTRRIDNCQLKPDAKRLYSPSLLHAWGNVEHEEAEIGDWFDDWRVIYYLIPINEDVDGEIFHAYCKTLEKIEFAIMAKEKILPPSS
ncbi:uncharacterized protein DUF2515 [Aneurinibacillus soli]|uniref:Uncharacterized protein n=1 Tax=Aneurinibacillus soli TaxID=1500254 RepID=A0A0U5B341_9BACL|nr:DUF2515 domain-containing protein [Aneurinibacillus soli]PYE63326.1 uncharacterized protein DUF2515 [Aneurinibacillus soli]BAU27743.1 hypothetical protein CB4_01917 [Aneurinibacillus soli]